MLNLERSNVSIILIFPTGCENYCHGNRDTIGQPMQVFRMCVNWPYVICLFVNCKYNVHCLRTFRLCAPVIYRCIL